MFPFNSKGRTSASRAPIGAAMTVVVMMPAAHAASEGQQEVALEEVVVTATKREVRLQELPQAVTAITARRLDDLNALSFEDYFRDVPGLMLVSDEFGHLDFTIRGVSDFSTNIPQTTATVGQYIDEIPVTSTGSQVDMRLVDIERIEVLRGPQGTYYGEGSLGGTIRIITKKPQLNEWSASVEGRLSETDGGGSNDQESLMINLPLWKDKLALRANYFNASDSGYIDVVSQSAFDGSIVGPMSKDANDSRSEGGRVTALLVPNDWLTVMAEAVHTETNKGRLGGYDPALGDLVATVVCPIGEPPEPAPGEPLPAPRRPSCYETALFQKEQLYNLTLNADFGWGSLVSSSSWSASERSQSFVAAMPGESTPPDDNDDGDAFAQEVRLVSSPSWSQTWDYAVGIFDSRRHTVNIGKVSAGPVGLPIVNTNKETALFGELGYKFASNWGVRLGARASHMRQDLSFAIPTPGGEYEISGVQKDYRPVTGRVVLNYTINNDIMVYGAVSNGFRQGGANVPAPFPGVEVPPSYDEDKATNYEVGWKISFPSLRAVLNGAIYHIDWKNTQSVGLLFAPGRPPLNYYRNAGDTTVDGFELEGNIEPIKGLSFNGSFSLIDARLDEDYVFSTDPLLLHGRKGDRIPFVAKLSGSLSVSFRRPLGASGWDGFGVLNGQYQGDRQSDFNPEFDNPIFPSYAVMDPYWTTGAQIGVESEQWRAALYADNLFDKRAQVFRSPSSEPGHYSVVTTQPLTIGVFVRRNFN